MSKQPVVLYGASGYTGRLVAEFLREYQLPFSAAGRNPEAIQAAMDKVPGIETASYEVVKVDHNVESLTELFSGAKVVCNTVGPFARFGTVVVEAALKAGCHYIDTTGEQDWIPVNAAQVVEMDDEEVVVVTDALTVQKRLFVR